MEGLPIDSGYAWFVALGAFINLFISLGTYRVYGVIFLEVLEYYDTTSALSSAMFGIFMLTCACALMLHSLIVDKVTERTIGLVGGVSFGLSLILQMFSPNIYYFIIIFGIFGGVGSTFTMYTAVISLGKYFRNRLSLASGLAFTGSSIGQLVIPQIMKLVLDKYDLKGAMLILGGIQLHPLISAMLFRPKSYYERTHEAKGITENNSSINKKHHSSIEKCDISISVTNENGPLSKAKEKDIATEVQNGGHSDLNNDNLDSDDNEESTLNVTEDENENLLLPTVIVNGERLSKKGSLECISYDSAKRYRCDSTHVSERNMLNSSLSIATKISIGSNIPDLTISVDDTSTKVEGDEPTTISMVDSVRILCTSPRFLLFTCGRCFSILAMYLVILFLPPYAIDNGCSMAQVTLMLSVVGACDLPSRPFHGWIVSFKSIDATCYVGLTTLVASVVIFICVFLPSYASVMVMGIGQGVFYNPVLCLMNVVFIDSVGQVLFPRAMMFTMIAMYSSMTFLPSVFGMLYDSMNSYLVPMCIAAGCGILGGVLTLIERKTR